MASVEPLTKQYLAFRLENEVYAVAIENVREVLELTSVTQVPRTPDFFYGVLNLRGNVVPVIDLRLRFGLTSTEPTIDTCIVVLEVEIDGEITIIGALADSVDEVVDLASDDIEPAPKIGSKINPDFIKGMGKLSEKFILILDVSRIFTLEELLQVSQIEGHLAEATEISTTPPPS